MVRNRILERITEAERLKSEAGASDAANTPSVINTRASRMLLENSTEQKRMADMLVDKYGGGKALPCLEIDPRLVKVGRYFNRLPQSFDETLNEDFKELLGDIKRTNGNLVSGLVRPFNDPALPQFKYELVFGERRLRACIKAGTVFKTEIADVSIEDFIQLHSTENRFRPQLSIVESALQFKSWLDDRRQNSDGLTSEALAKEVGYSSAHFFRLQQIGSIDIALLSSIKGVEKLAQNEIQPLARAWKTESNRESILIKSKETRFKKLYGKEAINYLCGIEKNNAASIPTFKVRIPTSMNKREEFVSKLNTLGAEYSIQFNVIK